MRRTAAIAALVAACALVVGAWVWPHQTLVATLWAALFCLGLSLGSLAVLMIQHLVGGGWGTVIRRPLEAAVGVLPWLAVAFLPLVVALPAFYAGASGHQATWLAAPFFIGRAVCYFAVWIGLGRALLRLSDAQDRRDDAADGQRLAIVSAAGLVLYPVTTFFASVDWIMAFEPGWTSTAIGLITVAGQLVSGLALGTLAAALCVKAARPRHFNDLGNLLLAAVLTWAYVCYAQYLVIWSGNLASDNAWYVHRSEGGWTAVIAAIAVLHLALPLGLLLFRDVKRDARRMAAVAGLLLAAQAAHLFWQVVPAVAPVARVTWLELAALVALGGGWLWAYLGLLAARPLLPLHGVPIEEAPAHAR